VEHLVNQGKLNAEETLTLARQLSHPYTLAYAFISATVGSLLARDVQTTQERAEILVGLCDEYEFAECGAGGIFLRGWALAERGICEAGVAQMLQGIAKLRATHMQVILPYFLISLGETYLKDGKTQDGICALAEARMITDQPDEHFYTSELYRIEIKDSKITEAETCFLKSLEIAQRQQAKSFELRAAVSLSRLWQQQGRREDARHLLGGVYEWFTEGFETLDLQEAKALLAQLS
jgi:predicted ATPase